MRRGSGLIAGLFLAVLAADPAVAADEAAMPELAELSPEAYAEICLQPHVLSLELRADAAVAAATLPLARRPEAIGQDGIPEGCLAVLIIDDSSEAERVALTLTRFAVAGCTLRRLSGDAADWISAGLAGPAAPRQSVRPGDVPFVIPRGLCEPGEPVQRFD